MNAENRRTNAAVIRRIVWLFALLPPGTAAWHHAEHQQRGGGGIGRLHGPSIRMGGN